MSYDLMVYKDVSIYIEKFDSLAMVKGRFRVYGMTVPFNNLIGALPGENKTPIMAMTSACLAPLAETRLK
jgi:hypothetical protein